MRQRTSKQQGFTLVEIMIVSAIIALLAAIAVPGFLRARKRSQASQIINDLRLIDAAVDQYAVDNNRTSGSTILTAQWTAYLKQGTALYNTGRDLFGNDYGAQTVDSLARVPLSTWNTLSDVAGTDFFSPYTHD
jgi:prepilin-type N-terminal cleavage/methylation domain-containing protein